MAGLKESLGASGRTQVKDVCSTTNFITQDPSYFVDPTVSGGTVVSSTKVGEPFKLLSTLGANTNAGNTVIYTVPSTWTVQVLDLTVHLLAGEVNGTVGLYGTSAAVCTAVTTTASLANTTIRMTAGYNTTAATLAASGTLRLLVTGDNTACTGQVIVECIRKS